MISLEMTIDDQCSLEYDTLLERATRAEETEYPPHMENQQQLLGDDGIKVPGCYMTQPAISSE